MKTAVEELIAKYNKQWNKYGMGSVIAYSQVVADLEKLKEMEKEQIKDAHEEGFHSGQSMAHNGKSKFESPRDYYNKTFKQEK